MKPKQPTREERESLRAKLHTEISIVIKGLENMKKLIEGNNNKDRIQETINYLKLNFNHYK